MKPAELKKGTLVIITDNREPSMLCWGLVLRITPGGMCDVQFGKTEEHENRKLEPPTRLIPVIETDGKFKNPEEAVNAKFAEILLAVTFISYISKEYRTLTRYKRMMERRLRNRFRRGIANLLKKLW